MSGAGHDRHALIGQLLHHLGELSILRAPNRPEPQRVARLQLRAWQAQRLAATYADLLADPRYRPAAEFFLEELYGPKDSTARDAELARVLPKLVRLLPAQALHTLAEGLHMDVLAERLDADMVAALASTGGTTSIDPVRYAHAWRLCGRRADRELQIELVERVGRSLDHLTRMPLISATLSAMRKPAEMAGLGALHAFLVRGHQAFRHMGGAEVFLQRIVGTERTLMDLLFDDTDASASRWSARAGLNGQA